MAVAAPAVWYCATALPAPANSFSRVGLPSAIMAVVGEM